MKSYIAVVVVVVAGGLTGCATDTRAGQTRLAIAGAAVAAGGGLLYMENREPDASEEHCPGLAPCGLERELAKGTGALLMVSGAVMMAFAGIGAIGMSIDEARPPTPSMAEVDPSACIDWRRQVEAEHDPARRGALRAARPEHCAEPTPPGKVAAPVDRSAAR
jgi:hypothetical protein